MSFDWSSICTVVVVLAAIILLSITARWIFLNRGTLITLAGLLIGLSVGVMLWMMFDLATDSTYEAVPETLWDWLSWAALTVPCACGAVLLPLSVMKSSYRLLLVTAALSSISIFFPLGIVAGVLIWWDHRKGAQISERDYSDGVKLTQAFEGGKMDLPRFAQIMESRGFKNVRMSSEYEGIQFHIVGSAKIGLQKMAILVRVISSLDAYSAERIEQEFLELHTKKSSYVFGTFFLYCLITERMDEQAASWLLDAAYRGTHGLKDTLGGGGGHMMIADARSRRLLVLRTDEGVTRDERRLVEILEETGVIQPA